MPLGDASLHCAPCPLDFLTLSLVRLHEHGEQHDPATSGDVVRDPRLLAPEVAAQSRSFPRSCRVKGSSRCTPSSASRSMYRSAWPNSSSGSVRSHASTSCSSSIVPQAIAAMLCLGCDPSSQQESQLDRDLDSAWPPGSIPVDSDRGAVVPSSADVEQKSGGGEGTRTPGPLDCQSSALPAELRPRVQTGRLPAERWAAEALRQACWSAASGRCTWMARGAGDGQVPRRCRGRTDPGQVAGRAGAGGGDGTGARRRTEAHGGAPVTRR